MMSISLTDFVDSIAGDRIAELEAEVERLEKRDKNKRLFLIHKGLEEGYFNWLDQAKAEGESDGRS